MNARDDSRRSCVVGQRMANRVTAVELKSDRLMMISLKDKSRDIVIVHEYMPTSRHDDGEVEDIYEHHHHCHSRLSSNL